MSNIENSGLIQENTYLQDHLFIIYDQKTYELYEQTILLTASLHFYYVEASTAGPGLLNLH